MLIEEAEAASFFPTAGEVVRAVQFVRENPAVVLGVVVGLTSLSVAKYYEDYEEGSEDDTAVLAAPGHEELREHHEETQSTNTIASTSKTNQECASIAGTDSTETIACNQSASNESSASTGSKVAKGCDQLHRNCSFCNQIAASPDSCCDPDWGWFIPTSPEDEHDGHHHALQPAPRAPHAHAST